MFKRTFFKLTLAAALTAVIGSAAAQLNVGNLPGVTKMANPQPVENDGKIEVIEFFGYGCIHCAHLEPALEAWIKRQPADVKVKRVPAPFGHKGVNSPPLYYSLEALGVLDKLHGKIFDAVHVDNVVVGNPATLNKWLEKNGVDPKKYEEVQKSFSVVSKVTRATKMTSDYDIQSTPVIVVNGRYQAVAQGGPEALFRSLDLLIADARASMVKAPPAKK